MSSIPLKLTSDRYEEKDVKKEETVSNGSLRCILDSPLNKAGIVGAIYAKIDEGAVLKSRILLHVIDSVVSVCNTIVEFLQKSSVRAKDTNEILLSVVEEPMIRHLPPVSLSLTASKVINDTEG
ncbi:unnamed protein product [Sphenostylis stenocarpa]|uniref:Uncharacterized protein n=1 Tax=Sphenostylis stenocarpa TaxID=92480 RepID=A0AA86RW16_9FABA|nr:unnamed protein product [Sphenostylis stenocarpa]